MWSRVYFAVLSVAFLMMGFFVFYANSWLGSIGDPKDAFAGFLYYVSLGANFLWISTFILLILANIILWNTRRGWAMWTSFAFFSVFTVLRYFWLEKAGYNFLGSDVFFYQPIFGSLLILFVGAVIFSNQFINLRLNAKLYPQKENEKSELAEIEESKDDEKNA